MNKTEKKMILKTLEELPDVKNLETDFTIEQFNYWCEVKIKFNIIYKLFDDYFKGKEETNLDFLPKNDRDFYMAKFDSFLAFYELIQAGWKYLKSDNFYDSPGVCFVAFLQYQSQSQIHISKLDRYDVSPRNRNEMIRLYRSENELSKGKELKLKNYIKKLENLGFLNFGKLEIYCLATLEKIKDDRIKSKLQRYLSQREIVDKIELRINRTKPAYAWENGKLLKSIKAGGTYA